MNVYARDHVPPLSISLFQALVLFQGACDVSSLHVAADGRAWESGTGELPQQRRGGGGRGGEKIASKKKGEKEVWRTI